MALPQPTYFSGAVEGIVDEAVAKRLIEHVGGVPHIIYGRRGKEYLRGRIGAFNSAARYSPWFILVDLNHEAACAPSMRGLWLPNRAPHMCFRIVVREIEVWLLADRDRLAQFLRLSQTKIPRNPENLDDPKQTMVDVARRSRKRDVVKDMVPRAGSGINIGPAYSSRLIEFIQDRADGWRPHVASAVAPSLARCLNELHTHISSATAGPAPVRPRPGTEPTEN